MKYGYMAMDGAGKTVPGFVEADSVTSATSQVKVLGLFPTSVFAYTSGPCACTLARGSGQVDGTLEIEEREGRKVLCFRATRGDETVMPLAEVTSQRVAGLFKKKLRIEMKSRRESVLTGDIRGIGKTVDLEIRLGDDAGAR